MSISILRIIPTFSDTIISLKELHTLDLTDNKLSTLPVNFYRMRSLKKAHCYQNFHKYGLWLHLNPLVTPPQEIWKTEDPEKIYTYMKKLQVGVFLFTRKM